MRRNPYAPRRRLVSEVPCVYIDRDDGNKKFVRTKYRSRQEKDQSSRRLNTSADRKIRDE